MATDIAAKFWTMTKDKMCKKNKQINMAKDTAKVWKVNKDYLQVFYLFSALVVWCIHG